MVIAFNAASISIPSFTASAAQRGRVCIMETGWSVVMAVSIREFDS